MAIKLVEEEWPITEWLFCDTGMEFPSMYSHLELMESKLGISITRISPNKSFEYWMVEHVKTKGKRIGEVGLGWPWLKMRWCTGVFKRDSAKRYLRKKYKSYVEYHGIALDESERALKNKSQKVRYLLLFFAMNEPDCLQLCYDRGFTWDGLYEDFSRVSCFCCPLKSDRDLFTIYKKYPDLWERIKELDEKSPNSFRLSRSISDLERSFKRADLIQSGGFFVIGDNGLFTNNRT